MDSTAGPLLHNVDLVSLDDDILLDYFRGLLLCKVSECNRITKHIVSSYHRYLLCHGLLFSRHAVCVCVKIFGSKFPIPISVHHSTKPFFFLPRMSLFGAGSGGYGRGGSSNSAVQQSINPGTTSLPTMNNRPEKVEAATNEVMAVTQLYNVYSSCIGIVC
jgi:hypothetical protein